MFSTEDLKTAIGATVIARRNAAARLREAGNPRNPFRALPGMEQQFFEAAQSVRSYDLVLNLLEREVKREARKRAGRTAQSAAAFIITAGLIILATLGFAAALLLMRCPVPAVSVTAFTHGPHPAPCGRGKQCCGCAGQWSAAHPQIRFRPCIVRTARSMLMGLERWAFMPAARHF